MKIKLLVIILTAISTLYFIGLASALEISINSPEKIQVNQEFDVSINIDSNEDNSYPIKIFINSSSSQSSISEVLTKEGWKKQYSGAKYYLIYPEEKELTIRAFEYQEETTLCVYVKTPKIYKECKEIFLESIDSEQSESYSEKDISFKSANTPESDYDEDNSPITLNTISEKGRTISKEAKIRAIISYSLAIICLFLLVVVYNRERYREL